MTYGRLHTTLRCGTRRAEAFNINCIHAHGRTVEQEARRIVCQPSMI